MKTQGTNVIILIPESQWRDFRWNIWQFGMYELLVEACANFLEAVSFSSKLIERKNRTHQDELLILAWNKTNQLKKKKPSIVYKPNV